LPVVRPSNDYYDAFGGYEDYRVRRPDSIFSLSAPHREQARQLAADAHAEATEQRLKASQYKLGD